MKEGNLSKELWLHLQELPGQEVTMFRNNTGMGWQGSYRKVGSTVTLHSARPLYAGLCKGSSYLIGWTSIKITPDMVGETVAIFTAIEIKTATGKVSQEQNNFIDNVIEKGGIAGVVRSKKDCEDLINDFKESITGEYDE